MDMISQPYIESESNEQIVQCKIENGEFPNVSKCVVVSQPSFILSKIHNLGGNTQFWGSKYTKKSGLSSPVSHTCHCRHNMN